MSKRSSFPGWMVATTTAGLVLSLVASAARAGDRTVKEIQLGKPVRVAESEALKGPDVVDLDGDGRLDLVSGTYAGQILFAKRISKPTALKFDREVPLKTANKDIKLNHW